MRPRTRTRSLRLRLWGAAAVSIVIALAIAGVGLRSLFERHVERQVEDQLSVDLNQIIGATSFAGGTLAVGTPLTDPRFDTPLSGYYWQVEDAATGALTRSRSLWDSALMLPPATRGDGGLHVEEINGPQNALLLAVDRTVLDPGGQSFRVAVAEDHAAISAAVGDYLAELAPALALLAAVLLAAMFVQITVGLAPLDSMRAAVREVTARRASWLTVAAPREVQPLADEINLLLDAQGKALQRARTRATDLAHGLKTPLQVLFADIRTLRDKGETALADEIADSAEAIRRHVERELARARLAPELSGKGECRVGEVVDGVVAVVKRTPEGERLAFAIDVPAGLTAAVDESDLSEILGNLIDNAARFARRQIRIGLRDDGEGLAIAVADDGPGLSDGDKQAVLARGVTTKDERTAGIASGLGLAIVSDIVEAYGGRLIMADAKPGLRVEIFLPRRG